MDAPTATVIGDGGVGLLETIRRRFDHVEQDLERQRRLRGPLLEILGLLERSSRPSGDRFIDALEAMKGR